MGFHGVWKIGHVKCSPAPMCIVEMINHVAQACAQAISKTGESFGHRADR